MPFVGVASFIGLIVFFIIALRATKKKTGTVKKMWLYTLGCFVILIICVEMDGGTQSVGSAPKQKSNSNQQSNAQVVRKVESKEKKTANKQTSPDHVQKTNSQDFSVDNPVPDKYLKNYLSFMDSFYKTLKDKINTNDISPENGKFLADNNNDGWDRYHKILYQTNINKESGDQAQKRIDVATAWEFLSSFDMDYSDYITTSDKISSQATQDEREFLKDYKLALGDFKNK